MRPADFRSSTALVAALLAGTTATAATVPPPAHAPPAQAAPAPLAQVATPASAASTPAVAASATALPIADLCPPQLPVRQTVSETIAGWTPLNAQGSYPFVRVAFYPGPPTDTSLIVPTIEFQGAAGLHDGWDLPARAGGYWMTCTYANTTASLTRQLPAGIDFCQADYDKRFLTLVVRRWSCGLRRTMLPPAPAHSGLRPAPKSAPKPTYKRGS
jgi:hypothetical protein